MTTKKTSFRREKKTRKDRPMCQFDTRSLGIAEHKVLVEGIADQPIFVSENAFFRRFVFPVTGSSHGNMERAARKIPGLSQIQLGKGVNWRLSLKVFSQEANTEALSKLLSNCREDSPLYLHLCSADERRRLTA